MKKKDMKLLGHIGVDSGQIMICDPCYIDDQWKEEQFKDNRYWLDTETGEKLQLFKDFPTVSAELPDYGMKTMMQMEEEGRFVRKEYSDMPAENNFSYYAVCKATLDKTHQLNFEAGHPGVAVATRTYIGDGYYPVYGVLDKDGRVEGVYIDFLDTGWDLNEGDDEGDID